MAHDSPLRMDALDITFDVKTPVFCFDEYEQAPSPMQQTYCTQISTDDYTTQGLSETERALKVLQLLHLILHLTV